MGKVKFDYILGKLRLDDNPSENGPLNLVGVAGTFAGLPDATAATSVGKVAFLSADDTGYVPTKESGFYLSNGVTWSFINIDLTAVVKAVDPTVSDDGTLGYFQGQSWVNTVTNDIFISTSVATGTANWKSVTNNLVAIKALYASFPSAVLNSGKEAILTVRDGVNASGLYRSNGTIWVYEEYYPHSYDEAGAPNTTKDLANGYYVNDLWHDQSDNRTFICADNTNGAAIWRHIDKMVDEFLTTDQGSIMNTRYHADTTGGAIDFTLGLSATETIGMIEIVDAKGNFGTNPVTLKLTGADTINGVTGDVVLTSAYGHWRLTHDNSGWTLQEIGATKIKKEMLWGGYPG